MHQGPVPNKKYMEPQVQCQLLTIQNLYDPDDSVTIHPINLTASGWINNDYCGLKKKFIQRENSSLSLNKTGYNKKQSLTTINNLNASKTNRILNLAVFPKKTDSKSNLISKKLKSNQSQLNSKTRNNLDKEVKYCVNKASNLGNYIAQTSLNDSANKLKTFELDLKYIDYKRNWYDILSRTKRRHELKWKSPPSNTAKLDDFEMKQTLGHGSYGTVLLCKHRESGVHYAMKILQKKSVVKSKQITHTINEKKILNSINFPFITSLVYSFKDEANLYMVLPFVAGGEMFVHLHRVNRFSETLTKFYCAQVVLAIEYLHNLDIIHRDLKPENTLISPDGYIKISDFGFAKHVM